MALNTNNDADLIRRVQGREPGAFGELYSKFQPKVERTLSYKFAELPIEDCLDIYQEIWVKVADKIHTYENKGFTAWLGKITTRITLNYIRHRRRKSPLYHSNCLDSELVLLQLESDENPFEDVLCSEKAQQLEERLDQLSDRQKEIMVLYY